MVLSAKSCGLEEPFSEDLMNKVNYLFQKKPKLKPKVNSVNDIIAQRLSKEKLGVDVIGNKRQKTNKYDIDDDDLKKDKGRKSKELSKEEMLNKRVKQKTDKFCWF